MKSIALIGCLLLGGCDVRFGGPPLVSAAYPPNQSANSEPQPLNSLPPGAANITGSPNAVQPNRASVTLGGF